MKQRFIEQIEQMLSCLNNGQMEQLHKVLVYCLFEVEIVQDKNEKESDTKQNERLTEAFISAKV